MTEARASSDSGEEIVDAHARIVAEGEHRLSRPGRTVAVIGAVGGFDVSIGVFALLVAKRTGAGELVGALAFSVGFVILTLANSELFTENFLVPIAALQHGGQRPWRLVELWVITLMTNLAGGAVSIVLMASAFPALTKAAIPVGAHYPHLGIGWRSFAGAMLGGALVTLMTWMQHAHDGAGPKVVAAALTGTLLAAGPVNHVIVAALEMFAGLLHGAPYGYLDLAAVTAWFAIGNLVGGIALVTGFRLAQAGGAGADTGG